MDRAGAWRTRATVRLFKTGILALATTSWSLWRRARSSETIAVISPDYWSAVFTKPEVRAAFAAKTMIPVRVRECATPKLYAQHVFIDFVGKSRDEARQLLIDGINRERVKREVEFPGESGDAKISIGKLPTVNSLLVGREAETEAAR